jgi:uncharacterized protein
MSVKISGEGKLLRIFIDEKDQWQGMPLYKAILDEVKKEGLAGATIIRGLDGFGASSRQHTANMYGSSFENPIVIEIVDSIEYIDKILPILDKMVTQGLISILDTNIIKYKG